MGPWLDRAYYKALSTLPDSLAVRLTPRRQCGRWPDLRNPQRFTDKIQHRKLHDRDPRMPSLVDKVLAKDWAAERLGPGWIIPTLWHGTKITPAILARLPRPIVLKANHASNRTVFLHGGEDLEAVAARANAWLDEDFGHIHREWAYTQVRRQLLVEPFIGELVTPNDYKCFTFDGRVELIQVDSGRFDDHRRDFYTPGWERLPLKVEHEPGPDQPPPAHFQEILRAAATLGAGLSFARIDFYDLADGPRFGEVTFYPDAGLARFEPDDYDRRLGAKWRYPAKPLPAARAPGVAQPQPAAS